MDYLTGTYKKRNSNESIHIGYTPIVNNTLADAIYTLDPLCGRAELNRQQYAGLEIALNNSLMEGKKDGEFIINGNTLKWKVVSEDKINI